MALITKQKRVQAEYGMYEDISDMIKLHDDTMISINDLGNLGLEKGMVEVIRKLYERKSVLKEISEAELYNTAKDKKDKMEEKLRESDQFFAKIPEGVRKTIDKFFVNQPENLARTKEWQSFHMIFSGTEQLSLMTKAEAYQDKLKDLEEKKKKFLEVKKEAAKEIRNVENGKLKESYKKLERRIQRDKKEYDREADKLRKLTTLEVKGKQQLDKYGKALTEATNKMEGEKKRYGAKWVGQHGLQAQKIQKDIDQLNVKLQKVTNERQISERKLNALKDLIKSNEAERNNDALNKALHEYENAYRETFDEKDSKIPETVSKDDWIKSCQRSAKKLLEKQNLHKGNHKDSKEFSAMMQAMEDIINYPDPKKNDSFDDLLEKLQKNAETYRKEKEGQFRPFPTTMRTTRIKMAKLFESWSTSMRIGLTTGVKQKDKENELNTFYENKGKPVKMPVKLGPNKLDRNVIPHVHKMLDKINENFKDSLRMEDTIEEVSADFNNVFNKEQIAYSLGYNSVNDVKNMRLSDVVSTLTQVYGYQPKENVNTKSVEQEIKEMDVDMEFSK